VACRAAPRRCFRRNRASIPTVLPPHQAPVSARLPLKGLYENRVAAGRSLLVQNLVFVLYMRQQFEMPSQGSRITLLDELFSGTSP
jgi:hypothetical protein